MIGMDAAGARIDQAAASQGKQQPAGGDEISIEALEQRQQRSHENYIDDPARAHGTLESNRRHELLAGQFVPRSDERDRGDDGCVKENADEDGHPSGFEKSLIAKFRSGFLRGFADGFESGYEIRDDLHDQQERNQGRVGKEWREVVRRSFAYAEGDKDDEQSQRAERRPVLEGRAEAD